MGDATSGNVSRLPEYPPGAYDLDESHENAKPTNNQPQDDGAAFHSQFSGIPSQQRADLARLQTGMTSYTIHSSMAPASFNMGAMAGALPDYSTSAQAQRGSAVGGPHQPANFRPQQMPQHPYGMAFHGGMAQEDATHGAMNPQAQRPGSLPGMQQQFSPYGQQMPQYYYQASPFSPPGSQQTFFPAGGQNLANFDRRTNFNSLQSPPTAFISGPMQPQGNPRSFQAMPGYGEQLEGSGLQNVGEGIQRPTSDSNISSVPRGPPRKPKQSGHALWVGNLPPGTTVTDLKDHFSRDATKDIESLFLISKSNCAFVNYRTEASCAAAMQRFHDSRFHGVRLVCRLRRGSAVPPGVPSGPASMSGSSAAVVDSSSPSSPQPTTKSADSPTKDTESGAEDAPQQPPASNERVPDKFFIVKSLTLQDLELSVRNGVWATQAHNEETLNRAFQTADNVYLIFSANKSGEYFGYARMTSPISEDATQVLSPVQRHEPAEAVDAPRTIPTPATQHAPKGHIIDDSARGTIFWEADHSDEEETEDSRRATEQDGEGDASGGPHTWGKPFRLEWVSTNRLPFYRTRGLRNPWNANREVKIARDGTELEPGVGTRLIQMFHRMGQPPPLPAAAAQMPGLPPMVPMPAPQMSGLPPNMRPF